MTTPEDSAPNTTATDSERQPLNCWTCAALASADSGSNACYRRSKEHKAVYAFGNGNGICHLLPIENLDRFDLNGGGNKASRANAVAMNELALASHARAAGPSSYEANPNYLLANMTSSQ